MTTSAVSAASQEGARLRLLRTPLQLALNNNRSRERCTRCTLAPMQVCAVSLSWRVSSRVSFNVCSHRRAIYVPSNLVCVFGREMVGLPGQLYPLNCKRYQVQHLACCYCNSILLAYVHGEARARRGSTMIIISELFAWFGLFAECVTSKTRSSHASHAAGNISFAVLFRGSSGDPEQRATPSAAEALGARR